MPSPTPPISKTTRTVGFGGNPVGLDDQFNNPYNSAPGRDPGDGDTANGGHGATVDGVTCDTSMSSNYHVHFFIGLFVNGTEIAIPDGTGMVEPNGEGTFNGAPNWTEYASVPDPNNPGKRIPGCYYHLHTHDATGVVHVEDPNPLNAPVTASLYTLRAYLDIFGVQLSPFGFGQYSGPVQIVTSGQQYRGGGKGYVYSNTYRYFDMSSGDPNDMPIYSHEVIWIMVGSGNPNIDQLPNIKFSEEY